MDSNNTQQTSETSGLVEQYPNLDGANIGEQIDATDSSEVEISIDDFIFEDTVVTISAGTTVTWVNNGDVRHDITTDDTSDISGVDSELLANGETFSNTFGQTGTFNYFCSPHPFQMRGVIVVQ